MITIRVPAELAFGLRLANDGAVAAGPVEGQMVEGIFNFSWLVDFLKGALDPAKILAAVKEAVSEFFASWDLKQKLVDLWTKVLASASTGTVKLDEIKNWVLSLGKGLSDAVMAKLKTLADATKTPIDDGIFAAAAKAIEAFWAGWFPVTPETPKPLLRAGPEDEEWAERWENMSRKEREEEVKRLKREIAGAEGIITSIFLSIAVSIVSRWGLEALKKFIANWFKVEPPPEAA